MNIKAFTREQRAEYLKALGQPKFREKQIFEWICRGAASADEMTNLPASLRQQLEMQSVEIELEQLSKSDGTRKFLLRFTDGKLPDVYIIPATVWLTPNEVFVDRDYGKPGQKSKPEYGISITKKTLPLLEPYRGDAYFGSNG